MDKMNDNTTLVRPGEGMDCPVWDVCEEDTAGKDRQDREVELYALAAAQPEVEDCSTDDIPDGTEPCLTRPRPEGKRKKAVKGSSGKMLVPDLTSMTKYLCSCHRLMIPNDSTAEIPAAINDANMGKDEHSSRSTPDNLNKLGADQYIRTKKKHVKKKNKT